MGVSIQTQKLVEATRQKRRGAVPVGSLGVESRSVYASCEAMRKELDLAIFTIECGLDAGEDDLVLDRLHKVYKELHRLRDLHA
jgi:hypothetical protein